LAVSPAHTFGQIIGDIVERSLRASLEKIAKQYRLYLDYKQPRPARDGRRKVKWRDHRGNEHEAAHLAALKAAGKQVLEIDGGDRI
jgi:hypothetical protein